MSLRLSAMSRVRSLTGPGLLVACALVGLPALAEMSGQADTDTLFEKVRNNVAAAPELDIIAEIDHARLAAVAGETMPPARVVIFSDPALDAALMKIDPRIGVDLPLRVLAFAASDTGQAFTAHNTLDYVASRYSVSVPQDLRDRHDAILARALAGVSASDLTTFPTDIMQPDGLVRLDSPFGFDETLDRLRAAVDMQEDTVWFGEVDFTDRALKQGVEIAPARLLLFGGPGPGGRAMAKAPTLGLDAFCQKMLVLERSDGRIEVLFNDLLALADRQDVPKSLPLRIINRRMLKTFTEALEG
ncbi:DUF302 domain-containing protein (plasmid) [Rhodobacteraceae bacterium SC52]|nr:DUF302 domain-containing protein [Rhodobacteraceae bacterium SC52]